MLKGSCVICQVAVVVAIIGCLNWGSIALLNLNFVEQVLGYGTTMTRVVYGLVGVAGVLLLLGLLKLCPGCKKG